MSQVRALRELTASDIIALLDSFLDDAPAAALAFDADGTLWSGDIGEEACVSAIEQELIRPEAHAALKRDAEQFGIPSEGSPSAVAERLVDAFHAGRYPELKACEMMVWCYAGWTASELREHVARTLARPTSRVARYTPLSPVIDWARRRGVHCVIISASPRLAVEEAARELGFRPAEIAAGDTHSADGRLLVELRTPIPYAESKALAGRALIAERQWLATFGDNVFDLHMLQAARLPVAVRPKPQLLEVLAEVDGAALFREV